MNIAGYGVSDLCVCGKTIPDTAIYYGFELSEDNDAPMAFINEWHDHCLGEWGWVRDSSDFGIGHIYWAEQADEAIRRRLDGLGGGPS